MSLCFSSITDSSRKNSLKLAVTFFCKANLSFISVHRFLSPSLNLQVVAFQFGYRRREASGAQRVSSTFLSIRSLFFCLFLMIKVSCHATLRPFALLRTEKRAGDENNQPRPRVINPTVSGSAIYTDNVGVVGTFGTLNSTRIRSSSGASLCVKGPEYHSGAPRSR